MSRRGPVHPVRFIIRKAAERGPLKDRGKFCIFRHMTPFCQSMTAEPKQYDHKRLCAALSSQDRLDILFALKDGSLCVSDLCKKLGREQTAVSHDLQHLEYANFIRARREGKFRFYSLNREFAEPFLQAVAPERAAAAREAGDLRSMIEQAPISIDVICRDGFILFVCGGISDPNDKGLRSNVGRHIDEVLADAPDVAAKVRRAIETDGPTRWTLESSGRLFETVSRPYHDDAGGRAGVVLVTSDVSQRLSVEKLRALGESEKRWRMLVQGSPDVIAQIDPTGTVLAINHAFHGLERSTVIGSSLYGFFEPSSRRRAMEALQTVFDDGRQCLFEAEAAGVSAGATRYECRALPYWKDGKVIAVTVTMRDLAPQNAATA